MRYEFQSTLLEVNQFDVWEYINTVTSNVHEGNIMACSFDEYPKLCMDYIRNSMRTNQEKIRELISLLDNDHLFLVTIGTVGSGKTAFHGYILEQYKGRRPIYYFGSMSKVPPFADQIYFDNNMRIDYTKNKKSVFDLLPNNSIIYVDELAHIFPKGAITQESLETLTVYRHKNLILLGSTQNSAIVSVDLVRFFSGIFILQTTLFHNANEREDQLFRFLYQLRPKKYGECVFFSSILQHEKLFKFNYSLPSFWEEKYSKTFY